MGKPRTPSQKKAYAALKGRLNQYSHMVQTVYDTLNAEAAKLALSTGYEGDGEFSWDDYPKTQKRIADLQARFVGDISSVVYAGTSQEWAESNLLQDLLVNKALKSYKAQVHGKKYAVYYQPNSEALKAFQERADHGMNLSDRLWKQSQGYRRELECAIGTAVEKGTSAVTLSKRISKYLTNFDQLKADYKEKYGKAADCHDCEYNSIRLARTEINMSYRTAEQKRWQQLDFVLGYEIKLSGSHPVTDICDELKGRYPKDFVWTGWHPSCMCYSIPILKTEEEFWADDDTPSESAVNDVPDKVHEWLGENAERLEKAAERGTLPYWLRDNPQLLEGMTAKKVEPALREIIGEADYSDIKEKVATLTAPHQRQTYVAFEPFSPIIVEKLREQHDLKNKLKLFESIINDERATVLNETEGAKTVMFPGHKGVKTDSWKATKQMAYDINIHGESVAFLPELDGDTSADALVLFKGRPSVADFKYSGGTNWNTLQKDIAHGFEQAGTVVLKLTKMDAGAFKDAIDYLVRNEVPIGNIKLINEYGKFMEIERKEMKSGIYRKKIKGFL